MVARATLAEWLVLKGHSLGSALGWGLSDGMTGVGGALSKESSRWVPAWVMLMLWLGVDGHSLEISQVGTGLRPCKQGSQGWKGWWVNPCRQCARTTAGSLTGMFGMAGARRLSLSYLELVCSP